MDGIPSADAQVPSVETPAKEVISVRITVTICISNGLRLKRKNLSYDGHRKLQLIIADLTSAIRLNKKSRFATTSQKGSHKASKDETPTRDEERENHDGCICTEIF